VISEQANQSWDFKCVVVSDPLLAGQVILSTFTWAESMCVRILFWLKLCKSCWNRLLKSV